MAPRRRTETRRTMEQKRDQKRRAAKDEKFLARKLAATRRYESNPANALKRQSRAKLKYAVCKGKIKRLPCQVCGSAKSHGHHHDYTKPYDVEWLCARCHGIQHRPKARATGEA